MSEPIAELLDRLDRALGDYVNGERTIRAIKDLTTIATELEPAKTFSGLSAGFAELDSDAAQTAQVSVGDLASVCRSAADQVRKDRDAPNQYFRIVKSVSALASDAEKAIMQSWRDLIERAMPGWDSLNSLADVLGRAQVDSNQVAGLKRAVVRVRELSRRLPDEGSRAELTAAIRTLRASVTVLIGNDQDDGQVQRFLRAAATGGAHVSAVTSDVRAWMREKDIEDSFKIVLGRPTDER